MTKPTLTDAEFDVLKRKRDAEIATVVEEMGKKLGWKPGDPLLHVHVSGAGECYCACPNGPCQHKWDGPDYVEGGMVSVTCSRCNTPAIYHDMRCAP